MENIHPDNQSHGITFQQKMIDWAGPIVLFLTYFLFYNFGKISPSELIKSTGLASVGLLSITLVIGSVSRFIPAVNVLKAHRKFWGISSFVFACIHALLVISVYFDWDISVFFNTASPRFWGLSIGLLSLILLFVITATSFQFVFRKLPPHIWKYIQNFSYAALLLAVAHFFLMEQKDGVLVIKRLLGQITYWFAILVIFIRILVYFLPKKDHPPIPPTTTT